LKNELNKHGVTKFLVTDGWKDILGVENTTREDNISALRHFTGVDNVHYMKDGYENLAGAITAQ
jgi:hypothetical protein